MNEHIELVNKWLAGEDVTTEELRANSVDARADARAAAAAAADAAARWVVAAAEAEAAARWVKRYEELIDE